MQAILKGDIMQISIEITDERQLALIEKLRGKFSVEEFVQQAAQAGLKLAEQNLQQQGKPIKFSSAKPEFKALDVAAVTEALKDKDPQHPVKIEVSRLINDYTAQLRTHAQANGNRLPKTLQLTTQVPIERVAFQITAEAINGALKRNSV